MEPAGRSASESAQAQFDTAAESLGLEPAARELLRQPQQELHLRFPVTMADGRHRVFSGFLILHDDSLGPARGRLRFHPQETLDRMRALAMWMTWQCATLGLPLGGCSGGIVCDPHEFGELELQAIARGWLRAAREAIGPRRLVLAPDVMVDARPMGWLLDELEIQVGARVPGGVAGKPTELGGSRGGMEAAGYGLAYVLREALRDADLRLDRQRIAIQGFGRVGRSALTLIHRMGGRIACVAALDAHSGEPRTLRRAEGIDPAELRRITDRFGGIDFAAAAPLGYEVLDGEAWLAEEAEILILAALEQQITAENVGRISPAARLVVEAAAGPLTVDAEATLLGRGVVVIPQVLAAAGGIAISYFEQVQGDLNFPWGADEVFGRLDLRVTEAYQAVADLAQRQGCTLREAALLLAVDRVARACRSRSRV